MSRECEHGYFMGKGCDACAENERLQQAENNLIVKLQFAESVIRDQDKAITEMVEAYGEMEKGIEDPILCHYAGLRLHNAMEDLRALVIPGYTLNYEPNPAE